MTHSSTLALRQSYGGQERRSNLTVISSGANEVSEVEKSDNAVVILSESGEAGRVEGSNASTLDLSTPSRQVGTPLEMTNIDRRHLTGSGNCGVIGSNQKQNKEEGAEMFRNVLFTMILFGGLIGGGVIGGSLLPGCGEDAESGGGAGGGGGTILNCAVACAKIDECERAVSACQQSCESFAAKISDSIARSIMDCIMRSPCDKGEGAGLEDYCLRSTGCSVDDDAPTDAPKNAAIVDASNDAKTRCECTNFGCPEELDGELWLAACLNDAATADAVNCLASSACDSLHRCGADMWRGTYLGPDN